ncbi:MAG: hypothetical protein JWM11_7784 [Planctomycetaceae bacterium]|nr:hypothetical protein [Planctomycetaceae bacterium]
MFMKKTPTSPARKILFRVVYADAVLCEAYVMAHDEGEAEELAQEAFSNGDHHHALESYIADMQALPAIKETRQFCFECGR